MPQIIYGLSDPLVGVVRYVGYTNKSLRRRLWEHIHESKQKCTNHKHKWIRQILKQGREPIIEVLEIIESNLDWPVYEQKWIIALEVNNLVNSTAGGEGLIKPSAEVKQRIREGVSKSLIGNTRRLGILHSEADKEKIRLGMKTSLKFKEGIANRRPAVLTKESRFGMGSNRGKSFTPARKSLIAESNKKTKATFSAAHWAEIGAKTTGTKALKKRQVLVDFISESLL